MAPVVLLAQHLARQTQVLFERDSAPWIVLGANDVLLWLTSKDPAKAAFIDDLVVRLWSALEELGHRGGFDDTTTADGPAAVN